MSLADFEFERKTNIIFGQGKVKEKLGSLLKGYKATKVLMTYGRSSIKKMGLYDEAVTVMKEIGVQFWELSGIRPNPEVSKVREGIKMIREHDIDFILAVGGGSVIDASKAMSYGHGYDGDVWEIIYNWWIKEEKKTKDIKLTKFLPIGTILTLSATGSEFNGGSVISNDETGQKLGCVYKEVIPTFSILDPTYTYSVSPYQTKAGGVDILSHLMEFYFGDDSPFLTQRITEGCIVTTLEYIPKALADPKNYEARSNLMWVSSVALSGFCASGREGGDWSNHGMEHECAAVKVDLTHGVGLAICTIGWMRYVCNKRPERFLLLGKNCFGMGDVKDPNKVVDWLEDYFVNKIQIPVYFSDDESTKDWTEEDSKKAAKSRFEHFPGDLGGYVKLKEDDMVKILNSRIKKE